MVQHWSVLPQESPADPKASASEFNAGAGVRINAAKKDETTPGDASDAKSTRAWILERDLPLSGWRNIWFENIVPYIVKSEDSYGRH